MVLTMTASSPPRIFDRHSRQSGERRSRCQRHHYDVAICHCRRTNVGEEDELRKFSAALGVLIPRLPFRCTLSRLDFFPRLSSQLCTMSRALAQENFHPALYGLRSFCSTKCSTNRVVRSCPTSSRVVIGPGQSGLPSSRVVW